MSYQTTDFGYEVKKSPIEGKGVFATRKWQARKKIGELTGEFLSQREVRRLATGKKRIHIYEFSSGYALHILNELRYINHQCAANAYLRIVGNRIEGECRIEVYALRNIEPGEEITLNYGSHTHGVLKCGCDQPV